MTQSQGFTRALYLSTAVNSFGSWCTVLGIALLVQKQHGGTALAFVWLLQSLPMIAFSRKVAEMFRVFNLVKLWSALQFIAAINALLLSAHQSLLGIYVFIVVGSTINSISTSVTRAMIGTYIEKDLVAHVFRKSGAITSSFIAFSPIAGAYISNILGLHGLFMIDAASFLLAGAILLFNRPAESEFSSNILNESPRFKTTEVLRESLRSFVDTLTLNSKLRSQPSDRFLLWSFVWYQFLVIGAFLTGLEFTLFEQNGLSKEQVGFALASWGLGNLIVLVLPKRLVEFARIGRSMSSYAVALLIVFFVQSVWGILLGLGVAGFFYAILGGELKGKLQASQPPDVTSLEVWAYLGQRTGLINIIVYLVCAALLSGSFNIARTVFCILIVFGALTPLYTTLREGNAA